MIAIVERVRTRRFRNGLLAGLFVLIGSSPVQAQFTEYALPTADCQPWRITAGPDGALWFTESNGNNIGRITTSGSITEYPLPTPGSYPTEITAGPDGSLWFVENGNFRIGRITTSGAITEFSAGFSSSFFPRGITAGPDGALWFTVSASKIGRMTTSGSITEYPLPTPGGYPTEITAGPDGALWFTVMDPLEIGRITTSGSATELPVPAAVGYDSAWEAIITGPMARCGLTVTRSLGSPRPVRSLRTPCPLTDHTGSQPVPTAQCGLH